MLNASQGTRDPDHLVMVRWTGDAKKPIKTEHLTLLLTAYLDTSPNGLVTIEHLVLEVFRELLEAGGADMGSEDDDHVRPHNTRLASLL